MALPPLPSPTPRCTKTAARYVSQVTDNESRRTTINYDLSLATFRKIAHGGDRDASWLDGIDPVSLYTEKACALYAAALLAANPGWGIVSTGHYDCMTYDYDTPDDDPCDDYEHGVCACMVHHFYVMSPDGMLHDIRGKHDVMAVQEFTSVYSIPDESFSAVLQTWHGGCADSADIADHAVRLTWRLRVA